MISLVAKYLARLTPLLVCDLSPCKNVTTALGFFERAFSLYVVKRYISSSFLESNTER